MLNYLHDHAKLCCMNLNILKGSPNLLIFNE